MCTTTPIDDDILLAARGLASRDGTSIGAVTSELARKGLNAGSAMGAPENEGFYGFRPLPKRGKPVSNKLLFGLREDGPC